jgi:transposase InsO family protein
MNPVIGLDISKEESHGQAFLDRGKPLIYLTKYSTRAEAEKSIFEYIEVFYNNERIHSTIGYQTPSEYERIYHSKAA